MQLPGSLWFWYQAIYVEYAAATVQIALTEGSPVSSFFKMVPSVVVAHCNIAVGNSNRASYELL